ncbi:MAG: SRPBCC family protein [Candidatus Nanopelagicales bacterium]
MSLSESVSVTVSINAHANVVYEAISDVSRMPDWSPELDWVSSPHDGPLTAGERFAGYNRRGIQFWRTTSTVMSAKPDRTFAVDVTATGVPVARWSYHVSAHGDRTELTSTWSDLRAGPLGMTMKVLGFAASGVWDRANHNRLGMAQTLDALKAELESR